MRNATWEDWEQWYDKEYGRKKNAPPEFYLSNFTFLSIVVSLVAVGSVMQSRRASAFSSSVMEHRDKMHKEASVELARSKRATVMTGDRNERIQTFLRHREAVHGGEEALQRVLPPPETCGADAIKKQ